MDTARRSGTGSMKGVWGKLAVVVAALAVAVCAAAVALAPANAYADSPVAQIGTQKYYSLEDAVNAAKADDTIVLFAGEYTTYGTTYAQGKTLNFQGAVDAKGNPATVWKYGSSTAAAAGEGNADYSFDGSTVSFENVSFKDNYGNGDYRGFVRLKDAKFENCTFANQVTYWGENPTFENCAFNVSGAYVMWLQTDASFTDCTFTSDIGKFINAYCDGGKAEAVHTVTFDGCAFISGTVEKPVDKYPAICLKGYNSTSWKVTFTDTSINTTSAQYDDVYTGSQLLGMKDAALQTQTLVTVDDEQVWPRKAAKIGDTTYESVEAAVKAAKTGQTVEMLCDDAASAQVNLPEGVTLDGNGYTLLALGKLNDKDEVVWSTADGEKMLLVLAKDSCVKDVVLDSNGKAAGVQAYAATGVKVEDVAFKNAKGGCGFLVNASQATLSGTIKMSGNEWGDYINLGWGESVTGAPAKCTVTFAKDAVFTDVKYVWTDADDIARAGSTKTEGTTAEKWADKFAVSGGAADHAWVATESGGDIVNTYQPVKSGATVTEQTVPSVSTSITGNDKAAIEAVQGKAAVSGVAEALTDAGAKKILEASKIEVKSTDKPQIAITAKVVATSANIQFASTNPTLTFSVTPVATVSVNGEEKAKNIAVSNDYLDGESVIAVTLPCAGVVPTEVVHEKDGKVVETFHGADLNYDAKAGTVTVYVTGFSDFTINTQASTYEVAFATDGMATGTMASQFVDAGESFTFPEPTFTPASSRYQFTGWSVDGVIYKAGDELAVTGDITAIATWKETQWTRLSGGGRYDTMANIVNSSFDATGGTVILATGENFADALAASGLAGLSGNAPIVLTETAALSSQAADQLRRLAPEKIIIVGGEAAVSADVETACKAFATVERLAGDNRYETALEIYGAGDGSWGSTAIVATGKNFADALSIAPFAYAYDAPIFLVGDELGEDVQTALKDGTFTQILIVGGTSVVSEDIEDDLKDIVADTDRLAGADRYATSVEIANYGVEAGMSYDGMAVATGANFPDALAGAAACGKNGSVILLVAESESGIAAVDAVIGKNTASITEGYFLGGTSAISSELALYIDGLFDK